MNEDKKSVLLIEDDPLLLDLYEGKFIEEEFLVHKAKDGEEGLKMAIATHPTIIILDSEIFSDLELLKRLRSNDWGKDVPILALCNRSGEEEAKKTLELGVKEYLVKEDITPSELVAKTKSHLN